MEKFDTDILSSNYSRDLIAYSLKFPIKKISKSSLVQSFLIIPGLVPLKPIAKSNLTYIK